MWSFMKIKHSQNSEIYSKNILLEILYFVFTSPEPKAQGELLWSGFVVHCVCVRRASTYS